jgi:uncharacterized 2Fe-2S/4Fe-4S cluster protein (DUF4445 family)
MAKMNSAQLSRVCVCGAFGQYLDVRNAQAVGLLPETPAERVELSGNTALAGCELVLLSPQAKADLAWLREHTTLVTLSQATGFEDIFLDSLYLRPLKVNQP